MKSYDNYLLFKKFPRYFKQNQLVLASPSLTTPSAIAEVISCIPSKITKFLLKVGSNFSLIIRQTKFKKHYECIELYKCQEYCFRFQLNHSLSKGPINDLLTIDVVLIFFIKTEFN